MWELGTLRDLWVSLGVGEITANAKVYLQYKIYSIGIYTNLYINTYQLFIKSLPPPEKKLSKKGEGGGDL